jgi:hypothetical protein
MAGHLYVTRVGHIQLILPLHDKHFGLFIAFNTVSPPCLPRFIYSSSSYSILYSSLAEVNLAGVSGMGGAKEITSLANLQSALWSRKLSGFQDTEPD